MLVEEAISYLESLPDNTGKSLDAIEKLIIRYSWQGKTYEGMESEKLIPGYSMKYIKTNKAPELWEKLTHILRLRGLITNTEQVTKKNVRIVLEPIVHRHQVEQKSQQLLNRRKFGNSHREQYLRLNKKSSVFKSNPKIKIK